jgi:hypothetical protein
VNVPWKKDKPGYVKQEQRLGKKPGARQQINSGRLYFSRGDVKQKVGPFCFLIDAKHRPEGSYRLDSRSWQGLKRMANKTPPGCIPMVKVSLGDVDLAIIEESVWDAIAKAIQETNELS